MTFVPPLDVLEDIEEIDDLPPTITITANYGNGCTATDRAPTMSGQVVLAISNSSLTDTSLNLDFALTATNLRRNGALVLNGSVSGHLGLTIVDGTLTSGNSPFIYNFQVADSSISGESDHHRHQH